MSPTLQEAIVALKPFFRRQVSKPANIVKSLSGRFKGTLRKGESSVKVIRTFRNTDYGRI